MESEEEPTQCLFCDDVSESIDNAVAHLHTKHHIDFSNLKGKFNMDQYSYIKVRSLAQQTVPFDIPQFDCLFRSR